MPYFSRYVLRTVHPAIYEVFSAVGNKDFIALLNILNSTQNLYWTNYSNLSDQMPPGSRKNIKFNYMMSHIHRIHNELQLDNRIE